MTEHLLECAVAAARPGTFLSCICDALRACETRSKLIGYALGQADMRKYLLADDTHSFSYGRRDALAEAVQRVEALPWTSETWLAHAERAAIIAAIKGDQE